MTVPRRLELRAAVGIEHGAAAGGQHDAALRGEVADDVRFAPAEARLAFDFEDPRDRGAGAGFDLMVGIDEALAQLARKQPADGGLARPHQADEDDVVFAIRHVTE